MKKQTKRDLAIANAQQFGAWAVQAVRHGNETLARDAALIAARYARRVIDTKGGAR